MFIETPTTYHSQTVEWDVVHVACNDENIASHLADVLKERHVVARVRQEDQLQIAVHIGAIGVAHLVVGIVVLAVGQSQTCATTYYTHKQTQRRRQGLTRNSPKYTHSAVTPSVTQLL